MGGGDMFHRRRKQAERNILERVRNETKQATWYEVGRKKG